MKRNPARITLATAALLALGAAALVPPALAVTDADRYETYKEFRVAFDAGRHAETRWRPHGAWSSSPSSSTAPTTGNSSIRSPTSAPCSIASATIRPPRPRTCAPCA
jgi:hypothetical protein